MWRSTAERSEGSADEAETEAEEERDGTGAWAAAAGEGSSDSVRRGGAPLERLRLGALPKREAVGLVHTDLGVGVGVGVGLRLGLRSGSG